MSALFVELLNNTLRRHTSKWLCLPSAGVKETSVGPNQVLVVPACLNPFVRFGVRRTGKMPVSVHLT